jgi:hypothetical protein
MCIASVFNAQLLFGAAVFNSSSLHLSLKMIKINHFQNISCNLLLVDTSLEKFLTHALTLRFSPEAKSLDPTVLTGLGVVELSKELS